jgi:hypothetical protein
MLIENWAGRMAIHRTLDFWKPLRFFLSRIFKIKGHGISLLIPLNVASQEEQKQRAKNWTWLQQYWESNLPGAEIVIGSDRQSNQRAFSKSVAVNDAASKAHGDIFVIADADVYIPAESILLSAKEIRRFEKKGWKIWFLPYRQAFRLTKSASEKILNSDPKKPLDISPTESEITNISKLGEKTPPSKTAHWYGAMVQVVSRKAFYTVGGWDPRFVGWGGEDHAAMAATDTLYGPHKTLPSKTVHLWHPVLTPGSVEENPKAKKRLWINQDSAHNNNPLSIRYYGAHGKPHLMRQIVDEFLYPTPQALETIEKPRGSFRSKLSF